MNGTFKMSPRSTLAALTAAASLVAASPASAAVCVRTYQVNLALELINIGGDAGTLAGTICTDGTLGTLGAANIVEWNLALSNPFLSGSGISSLQFVRSGPGAAVTLDSNYGATPLSATATELLFDFTPAPNGQSYKYFGFEQTIALPDGPGGMFTQERFFYWYVSGNFRTRYYGWDNPDPFPGGGQATYTGDPVSRIGTSTPPTVPTPGSLALALLGLAAAGAAARSRARTPRKTPAQRA
jgi:hypothetical protein